MTRHRRLLAMAGGVLGIGVLTWGEVVHWRASYCEVGRALANVPGTEAVVVLGFRNRGSRANAVNRWRARAGLRSQRPNLGQSRLVLCGGAVGGTVSEAELMARYLRRSRGYRGELRLDTNSHSTWQNVENAIPLIEDVDRIKVVSHALHAAKARLYLARLRPDLAAKLTRGAEYRVGEWILAKPLIALAGRRGLARAAKPH